MFREKRFMGMGERMKLSEHIKDLYVIVKE